MPGRPASGDLVLALTAGGMPTPGLADRPDSDGLGRGCRQFLATHPRPDLALIAKPGDAVSVEEAGIALFRVRVGGDLAYTGTRHRAPVRHALLDAARLVDRLEAWFPRYSAAAATPTVTPQAAVTAIRGGWPDEPAFLPSVCEVWIDMRLAPGATLDEVEALLAAAVADAAAGLESDISVERLGGFPGAATPRDAWIARAAIRAWEARTGRPHVEATATSGVTDASLLRAAGIPTARIGMPRPAADPPYSGFSMGVVHIDPMTALATTLVDVAGDTLSRPRSEVIGRRARRGGPDMTTTSTPRTDVPPRGEAGMYSTGRQDWATWPRYEAAVLGFPNYWYPVTWSRTRRSPAARADGPGRADHAHPRRGRGVALPDRCPHRGVPLSHPMATQEFPGTWTCCYHGWTYDLKTGGSSPPSPTARTRRSSARSPSGPTRSTSVSASSSSTWATATPAPIEEDIPEELLRDSAVVMGRITTREGNWRFGAENGFDDGHAKYLHRRRALDVPGEDAGLDRDEGHPRRAWITRRKDEMYYEETFPGLGPWPPKKWWKRGFGNKAKASLRLPGMLRVRYATWTHFEW